MIERRPKRAGEPGVRPPPGKRTDAYDPGTRGVRDHGATRHIVDINLGLLTTLGLASAAAEFPIDEVRSEAALAVARRTDGRYALLNPGAAWPNKRWPPDRLGAVARQLRDRYGLRSAVLWGPSEEPLAQQVVAASADAAILRSGRASGNGPAADPAGANS